MKLTSPCKSAVITLLLLVTGAPHPLGAQPGDLDSTFGSGGIVTTDLMFATQFGQAVGLQSDGRIVVASSVANGSVNTTDFAVVRYKQNGALDSSFGSGGKVATDFGLSMADNAESIAIQGDDRIVVAGYSWNGSNDDFALVRYTATGVLDTAFGSGGKVTTDFAGGPDQAKSVALQSDGKIVVAGSASNGSNFDFAVARYNTDGTLDSGFGSGGKVTTPIGSGDDYGRAVVLQGDGKIIVAGYAFNGSNNEFAVVRYNPDGSLDSSFGTGGKVMTDLGSQDNCFAVALQGDAKIVAAGSTFGASDQDFALARYNSDGTLDNSFGGGGKVTADFGHDETVRSIGIQADGRIVLGGSSSNSVTFNSNIALARYNLNGTLDSSFGSGGKVMTDVAGDFDEGYGLALQSDGAILACGYAVVSGHAEIALLRYLSRNNTIVDPPVPPPVLDSTGTTVAGAAFLSFAAPAVDAGLVGGAAVVGANGRKDTIIYGNTNGDVLVQTGGTDGAGATFVELGDPVFAGEALGFAAKIEVSPSVPGLRRVGFSPEERTFAIKPGGRVDALYSQLNRAGGVHRLAAQADPAPGGGQFARFNSFALPRNRPGLLYSGVLHRDGAVTPKDDFGLWRERSDGTGTDLLLRTGTQGVVPGTARMLTNVVFMPPLSNASDQRLSHAPDGGLGALAKFDDGGNGVVRVAADGSVEVPIEQSSAVPDEAGTADGTVQFIGFAPPATASGGRLALLATLKAAVQGRPAPAQGIFTNVGGRMQRMLARGDFFSGTNGPRFGQLGQPLLGEKGVIGLIAALTGKGISHATNKVLVRIENGRKTVIAQLGRAVPDYGTGVVYRRFLSMVVTDSDPARVVFTAVVSGPGVTGSNNMGLWSHSPTSGTKLVLRSGGSIKANGQDLTIRNFEALVAPKKSQGQGRSTDASGFVTAKAKLSDGRVGVLRIPLP